MFSNLVACNSNSDSDSELSSSGGEEVERNCDEEQKVYVKKKLEENKVGTFEHADNTLTALGKFGTPEIKAITESTFNRTNDLTATNNDKHTNDTTDSTI